MSLGMNLALIREAVTELQRRKLRTGLTLLGMIFGVGAIVAMLAVGEGSRREALRLVAETNVNVEYAYGGGAEGGHTATIVLGVDNASRASAAAGV